MGLGKSYAVLLNPRTLDLVEARWERMRPFASDDDLVHNYTLGPPRDRVGSGRVDWQYAHGGWPRAHSLIEPEWLGRGFGAVLYCSMALHAREWQGQGVMSISDDRTEMADRIWAKLIEHGLAHHDRGFDYLPATKALKSGLVISAGAWHTKPPPEVVINARVRGRRQAVAIEALLAQQYGPDVAAQFATTTHGVAGLDVARLPAKARRWLKRYETLDV